jgi:hypothetical protein
MAELNAADVQTYTGGRLQASNAEVQRMLRAALSVARRECGWHVSPVRVDDEITLDGPDSRILWLPTLSVQSITSISEDGTDLDVATIARSAGDAPGLPRRVSLRKRSKGYWTDEYGGITIVMSHGYDEDTAEDWRQAILSMVDQMSLVPVTSGTGMSEFGLTGKRVDDVDYRYNAYAAMAEEVVFSISNVLCDFKLPSVEYF